MNILLLEDDPKRIEQFEKRIAELNSIGESASMIVTKHAYDAINALKNYKFDLIFLDHDLNGKQMNYDEEDCGTVVAKHIEENPLTGVKVLIHSLNFPASERMKSMIPGSIQRPFLWEKDVFHRTFNIAL